MPTIYPGELFSTEPYPLSVYLCTKREKISNGVLLYGIHVYPRVGASPILLPSPITIEGAVPVVRREVKELS